METVTAMILKVRTPVYFFHENAAATWILYMVNGFKILWHFRQLEMGIKPPTFQLPDDRLSFRATAAQTEPPRQIQRLVCTELLKICCGGKISGFGQSSQKMKKKHLDPDYFDWYFWIHVIQRINILSPNFYSRKVTYNNIKSVVKAQPS